MPKDYSEYQVMIGGRERKLGELEADDLRLACGELMDLLEELELTSMRFAELLKHSYREGRPFEESICGWRRTTPHGEEITTNDEVSREWSREVYLVEGLTITPDLPR